MALTNITISQRNPTTLYDIPIMLSAAEISILLGIIRKEALPLNQDLLTGKSFNREGDSRKLNDLNLLSRELELVLFNSTQQLFK